MINYKPAKIAQPMVHLGAEPMALVPPPGPDAVFTGYTGLPGFVESLLVLGILGAASWTGISLALKAEKLPVKAAAWVGGVGSALLGALYLGGKSGLNQDVGLPAVRVTPV